MVKCEFEIGDEVFFLIGTMDILEGKVVKIVATSKKVEYLIETRKGTYTGNESDGMLRTKRDAFRRLLREVEKKNRLAITEEDLDWLLEEDEKEVFGE